MNPLTKMIFFFALVATVFFVVAVTALVFYWIYDFISHRVSWKSKETLQEIHIVFDGPPGPVSGRFVKVILPNGESIGVGRWLERNDNCWALVLPVPSRSVRRQEDE